MDANEKEELLTALLNRISGHAKAPARSAFGIGSGVARPVGLDSPDVAVQRDARAAYVKAMTDKAPVEQLSPAEKLEYFKATQDVLRQDGYYV
jgi:hypothetical protein